MNRKEERNISITPFSAYTSLGLLEHYQHQDSTIPYQYILHDQESSLSNTFQPLPKPRSFLMDSSSQSQTIILPQPAPRNKNRKDTGFDNTLQTEFTEARTYEINTSNLCLTDNRIENTMILENLSNFHESNEKYKTDVRDNTTANDFSLSCFIFENAPENIIPKSRKSKLKTNTDSDSNSHETLKYESIPSQPTPIQSVNIDDEVFETERSTMQYFHKEIKKDNRPSQISPCSSNSVSLPPTPKKYFGESTITNYSDFETHQSPKCTRTNSNAMTMSTTELIAINLAKFEPNKSEIVKPVTEINNEMKNTDAIPTSVSASTCTDENLDLSEEKAKYEKDSIFSHEVSNSKITCNQSTQMIIEEKVKKDDLKSISNEVALQVKIDNRETDVFSSQTDFEQNISNYPIYETKSATPNILNPIVGNNKYSPDCKKITMPLLRNQTPDNDFNSSCNSSIAQSITEHLQTADQNEDENIQTKLTDDVKLTLIQNLFEQLKYGTNCNAKKNRAQYYQSHSYNPNEDEENEEEDVISSDNKSNTSHSKSSIQKGSSSGEKLASLNESEATSRTNNKSLIDDAKLFWLSNNENNMLIDPDQEKLNSQFATKKIIKKGSKMNVDDNKCTKPGGEKYKEARKFIKEVRLFGRSGGKSNDSNDQSLYQKIAETTTHFIENDKSLYTEVSDDNIEHLISAFNANNLKSSINHKINIPPYLRNRPLSSNSRKENSAALLKPDSQLSIGSNIVKTHIYPDPLPESPFLETNIIASSGNNPTKIKSNYLPNAFINGPKTKKIAPSQTGNNILLKSTEKSKLNKFRKTSNSSTKILSNDFNCQDVNVHCVHMDLQFKEDEDPEDEETPNDGAEFSQDAPISEPKDTSEPLPSESEPEPAVIEVEEASPKKTISKKMSSLKSRKSSATESKKSATKSKSKSSNSDSKIKSLTDSVIGKLVSEFIDEWSNEAFDNLLSIKPSLSKQVSMKVPKQILNNAPSDVAASPLLSNMSIEKTMLPNGYKNPYQERIRKTILANKAGPVDVYIRGQEVLMAGKGAIRIRRPPGQETIFTDIEASEYKLHNINPKSNEIHILPSPSSSTLKVKYENQQFTY